MAEKKDVGEKREMKDDKEEESDWATLLSVPPVHKRIGGTHTLFRHLSAECVREGGTRRGGSGQRRHGSESCLSFFMF